MSMPEPFRGGAGIGSAIVLPARTLSASVRPNASVGRAISSGAATGRTIQTMGGNGDLTDQPVDKWDREAKPCNLFSMRDRVPEPIMRPAKRGTLARPAGERVRSRLSEYGYPPGDEMPVDKTGAHAAISAAEGRYTITVAGRVVGHASFADRGDQRVFDHTEIHPEFGGRGLATLLVEEALNDARDAGKRIVPVCSMIGTVLHKHAEFDEITDPVTEGVLQWLQTQSSS